MGNCLGSPPVDEDLEKSVRGRQAARMFRFIKLLGKGSWGSVYLVERLTDGKQYALKQTAMTEMSQKMRWTAVNEVRIMASLASHPHVVNCKEAFLDSNLLCIVMELMSGGELADVIQRHAEKDTYFPEVEIWNSFIQIALGLQYLHRHGVLHRDIKPQNILFGSGGRLKIADLGIAHVVQGSSVKYRIGTPHYMAPEMWRRDEYSYPVDIWALGCVVHEMCTRRPLFLAENDKDIESRVIAGVVPPISKRYSQELRDLIASMLQYFASDRPTIDDILAMPSVRSRIEAATEESWRSMNCGGEAAGPACYRIMAPIEVPADLEQLNEHLPPSRYSIGDGIVDLIRAESARKPLDLPTIEDLSRAGSNASSALPSMSRAGSSLMQNSITAMGSGALSVADSAFEAGAGLSGSGGAASAAAAKLRGLSHSGSTSALNGLSSFAAAQVQAGPGAAASAASAAL